MPSDALALPSDENGGYEAASEPLALIPPGITLAPEVDSEAADPALTEGGRRVCVAATVAGPRCQAPAIRDLILCSAHAGRLDSAAGGRARAEQLRLVRDEAQNREITARLGTRAIVANALKEKHEEIRLAVHALADLASEGDRQAALALIPWINQGLGMPSPTQATAVVQVEGEELDLKSLDTAQLRALLAPTTPPEPV